MKNFTKILLGFITLFMVGCVFDTESTKGSQNDTASQVVVQTKINGFVAECRNYKDCDTSEAKIIYYISLEDGRFFEISQATYYACRDHGNGLYPSCMTNKP